ncbi:MAG TPA: HAD-IA family hydrolase [Thermoleophilia bacterium]|nr:HAD-IA family hydrolase [Thermoleophilia bacterium]HQJ98118.1 HAD-IA family hydrolase [Thermoleophilia bacterium]
MSLPTAKLVLFDVDYTVLEPGEVFAAEGYRAIGERYGLRLDPSRWHEAERAAYEVVKRRRAELGATHDEGAYHAIADAVINALGGGPPAAVAACTAAVVAEWVRLENFALYDDVLPCFERLRDAGVRIGLVSNSSHDLDEIVASFALAEYVALTVASVEVGLAKPSPAIFGVALQRAGEVLGEPIMAGDTVMVGDSVEDDVKGALACGMGAVLLDRAGRYDLPFPTIRTLAELPALLSL